jgi:hypothetical protein
LTAALTCLEICTGPGSSKGAQIEGYRNILFWTTGYEDLERRELHNVAGKRWQDDGRGTGVLVFVKGIQYNQTG